MRTNVLESPSNALVMVGLCIATWGCGADSKKSALTEPGGGASSTAGRSASSGGSAPAGGGSSTAGKSNAGGVSSGMGGDTSAGAPPAGGGASAAGGTSAAGGVATTSGGAAPGGGQTSVTPPRCGAMGCGVGACDNPTAPPQVPFGTLTVPTGHPRLWFDADRLTRARAWFAANSFKPRDPIDGAPETYLDLPLAALLSGNLAQCDSRISWLMGLTLGTDSPGDDARWVGEVAILTYDWCYERLSAAQRSTFITTWNGFIDAFNTHSWGGLTMPHNNYYWGFLRNTLEFGIATMGDNPHAQALIDHALNTRWRDSFLPWAEGTVHPNTGLGGLPPEGSQYGRYLLGYGVVPLTTTTLDGRNVYDETDFFKGAVYTTVYMTPPAQSARADGAPFWDMFPFGDDERWLVQDNKAYDSVYYGDFMQSMAELWKDRPVGQIARRWVETTKPTLSRHIAAVQSTVTSTAFDNLPLDYFVAGGGIQFVKNTWDAGGTAMMAQLSYPMDPPEHQHFDIGSFQLWRAGQWLTRESVSYTEMIAGYKGVGMIGANQEHGHNGILFHGTGAADGVREGYPKVLRLESQDAYAYSAVDLRPAYRNTDQYEPPERDNPYVASLVREFLYLRGLDVVLIFDRLGSGADSQTKKGWAGDKLAPEAVEKTFLLHATAKPTVSGNVVTITAGNQQLLAHFLAPASPTIRVVDEGAHPVGQFRVEADTSGTALSYFVTALELGAQGSTAVDASVVEATDGFTVTLKRGSASAVVTLVKGATSSGGTVALNGAAATPLRTTVQPMTITDCGPVWGK